VLIETWSVVASIAGSDRGKRRGVAMVSSIVFAGRGCV